MPSNDTFEPHKRTLGQLLSSSTSPPLRVPDYQRDYSWDKEQVSEFWDDLTTFAGSDSTKKPSREYFLGATVLVDNGTFHLVLDGQQRLATATILLAVLRDRMQEFNNNAAKQLQDQFIVFQDELTGKQVFRLELNIFDRGFFRDFVQAYPRVANDTPQKKSHYLISKAYSYFEWAVAKGWDAAGGVKKGFEWSSHIAIVLRQYIVLITAVSSNEVCFRQGCVIAQGAEGVFRKDSPGPPSNASHQWLRRSLRQDRWRLAETREQPDFGLASESRQAYR